MFTMTLEEQNGDSMVVGEFASLGWAESYIKEMDEKFEAWAEAGFPDAMPGMSDREAKLLRRWEGCELSTRENDDSFWLYDEARDDSFWLYDEEWYEICTERDEMKGKWIRFRS